MSRAVISGIVERSSLLQRMAKWDGRSSRSPTHDSFRATAARHALAARRVVEHLAEQVARDAAAAEKDPTLSPVGRAAKVESLRDGLLSRLTTIVTNGSASLQVARAALEEDLVRSARAAATAIIGPEDARQLLDLLGRRSPAERAAAVKAAVMLDEDPALRAALSQAHERVRSEYLSDAGIDSGTWDELAGDLLLHATPDQAAQVEDLNDIGEVFGAARLVVESQLVGLGVEPIATRIRDQFAALDAGSIPGQASPPADVAKLAEEYTAALHLLEPEPAA